MACIACSNNKIKFFTAKNGYQIFRCLKCGLLFVDPLPSISGELYSDDYFTGASQGFGYVDYDQDKEAMKNVFVKYLSLVEKHKPQKGKLLDVGAATGYFADLARQMGWDACGVELSDFAADLGRKKGLDIRTGTLADLNFPPGTFDVITFWDVLEHFSDPAAELKKANALLRPDGIIVANTPDSASLFAKTLGKRWHSLVPPEHLFFFNQKSLQLFLVKYNFESVKFLKIGKVFTIQYIIQVIANWLKLRSLDRFSELLKSTFLSKIAIPLNLRDIILVIAKKINT